ncbi:MULTISPECIES: hypothetical protein [Nocardia]|uniref:hypothetical protein n=1 Tax=Nocardia TaxID=1817 RepID=UPI000D68C53D|nr:MULTISPECIES: hypothetical protein [Nocardia]
MPDTQLSRTDLAQLAALARAAAREGSFDFAFDAAVWSFENDHLADAATRRLTTALRDAIEVHSDAIAGLNGES